LAEELAGHDFSDFFRRYVAGTDEVPFEEILARGGLALHIEERTVADPGFRARRNGAAGVTITDVTPGGPAEHAGLVRGDVIVAVNGHEVPINTRQWFAGLAAGDSLHLRVSRGEQTREIAFVVGSRTFTAPRITEADVSGLPRAIRAGILSGTNPAP